MYESEEQAAYEEGREDGEAQLQRENDCAREEESARFARYEAEAQAEYDKNFAIAEKAYYAFFADCPREGDVKLAEFQSLPNALQRGWVNSVEAVREAIKAE